jgi:hypothetical protein
MIVPDPAQVFINDVLDNADPASRAHLTFVILDAIGKALTEDPCGPATVDAVQWRLYDVTQTVQRARYYQKRTAMPLITYWEHYEIEQAIRNVMDSIDLEDEE